MLRRRSYPVSSPPRGFRYLPEFLSHDEEQSLISQIEALPFEHVQMHGVEGRREVVHFGVRYQLGAGDVLPAPPMPAFLFDLRHRVAAEARFPPQAQTEVLATRYQPGAGIGWHRDAPPFGPVVAGVSLGSSCEFRLRLMTADGYDVYKTELAPCSLYVLAGTARFRWQHAIPPVRTLRYSLTFRTVRQNATRSDAASR